VSAYTVPTQTPEADGTLAWNETTLVLVRTFACSASGYGYSFADIATAHLIDAHLKHVVVGGNCLNVSDLWSAMARAIRNLGRSGICSMAISAIDSALWAQGALAASQRRRSFGPRAGTCICDSGSSWRAADFGFFDCRAKFRVAVRQRRLVARNEDYPYIAPREA
jgi:hypothetical protein